MDAKGPSAYEPSPKAREFLLRAGVEAKGDCEAGKFRLGVILRSAQWREGALTTPDGAIFLGLRHGSRGVESAAVVHGKGMIDATLAEAAGNDERFEASQLPLSMSALAVAAQCDMADAVEALLRLGANPSTLGESRSAAASAALAGSLHALAEIAAFGADLRDERQGDLPTLLHRVCAKPSTSRLLGCAAILASSSKDYPELFDARLAEAFVDSIPGDSPCKRFLREAACALVAASLAEAVPPLATSGAESRL